MFPVSQPIRSSVALHAVAVVALALGSSAADAPTWIGDAPAAPAPNAAISVQALVEDPRAPGSFAESAIVAANTRATRLIQVANSGEATLADVRVTGAAGGTCDRSLPDLNGDAPGVLDPGQRHSFTCSAPVGEGAAATVSAHDLSGAVVRAFDAADVRIADPAIRVSVDLRTRDGRWSAADTLIVPPALRSGATATFRVRVKNSGNTALSAVAVRSPRHPACARGIGHLGAGQTASYLCAQQRIDAAGATVASVSGQLIGDPVRRVVDSDRAAYRVLERDPTRGARLTVRTAVARWAQAGGTLEHEIVVRNVGSRAARGAALTVRVPAGALTDARVVGAPSGAGLDSPAVRPSLDVGRVDWSVGAVPPGTSRRLVFTTRVARSARERVTSEAIVWARNAPRVRARSTTIVRSAVGFPLPPVAG